MVNYVRRCSSLLWYFGERLAKMRCSFIVKFRKPNYN